MKQNKFADLEDKLEETGLGLIIAPCLFITLIYFWMDTGTFWGAIFITILGSLFFGGIPAFLVAVVITLFARRDYDA
ncbi:MAG: hypothetical protein LBE85_01395 [Candidatus Accumulibacter sp.]|jgi:hypothetical protein|nr:hypothetical protein [Accumulibacter sp.]